MSEIEKIQRYIDKHGVPCNLRYDINFGEARAIVHEMTAIEAVSLAFDYGKAKGYRAAKAEARKKAAV